MSVKLVVMSLSGGALVVFAVITPVTGTSIVTEIGDIGRFPSVKQFLTYAGCAPTIHQSGTKVVHG